MAIENLRFEIYFCFSRIQTYRNFTSYGGYLLNTKLLVPSIGFSVAGLNRAKLGVYQLQSFLFIVVIVISILLKTAIENYIWTNFNLWSITGEKFIAMRQGKITFIEIKKYRHGLWKTTGISTHLNGMLEVVEITLILLIFEWLIYRKLWSRVSRVLNADFVTVFSIKRRENLWA